MKQKLIPFFFFLVVKWRSTNMIIWLITTKCKFWVLQRNTTLMQANGFFLVTICQDTYQKHVQSRGWHGFKARPLIWWQPSIKLTLQIILLEEWNIGERVGFLFTVAIDWLGYDCLGTSQLFASCRKITKIKKLSFGATQLF